MHLKPMCLVVWAGMLTSPLLALQPEGVIVRGHWLIEVYNRDGSLAERRELQNHLTGGARALADAMARQAWVGAWTITMRATDATLPSPWFHAANPYGPVSIVEAGTPGPDSLATKFESLSVSTVADGAILLKGRATALRNGGIGVVSTAVQRCTALLGSTCAPNSSYFNFSEKQLEQPIHLEFEQDLQITVTISFSSSS